MTAPLPSLSVQQLTEQLEAAKDEVERLCEGGRWRMSVPVDEKHDSDVVIMDALLSSDATIRRLQAACDAQQAVIDAVTELHQPWHHAADGTCLIGKVNPDPDGITRCTRYCVPNTMWPCPTATALASPDTAHDAGAS